MTSEDKYSIVQQLEESLQKPEILARLEHYPDVLVSAIWEEVYPKMPLCDPDDSSPERLMQVLKQRYGASLKIEESCGLFSIIRLTLSNSVCYIHKCPGSYYILPMYRNVRRFHTRLEAEDAADLILEFDRLAPLILRRIEDMVMEWKQKQLTLSLIKSSVSGVIESLKRKKRIAVPDKVTISGTSLSKINVCFKSHKVIRCSLEELEGRLVKEFGIQDKDQCNDMHQSEYNTSGRK